MNLIKVVLCVIMGLGLLPGCSAEKQPAPVALRSEADQAALDLERARVRKEVLSALPRKVSYPADNPYSKEKEVLGKLLYFDPILSGGKDVSCATCHHPSMGFAEQRDLPIGVNGKGLGKTRVFKTPNDIPFTKRNSPTVINAAYNGIQNFSEYVPENAPMFWDSRAKSLEEQALKPIKAFEEMRGHGFSEEEIYPEVERRLKEIPEYAGMFARAFEEEDPVTITNVVRAIATFERSVVANNTRFDQYKRGDYDALSKFEKLGLETFKRVGCNKCHNGPMFSDYDTHVLGVPHNKKLAELDLGLKDTGAFRTPTLRNLRDDKPYMHNGEFKTIQQVLEFYEDIALKKDQNLSVKYENLDKLVKEVSIKTIDFKPIEAFLFTLNEEIKIDPPAAVPSGLKVGGE